MIINHIIDKIKFFIISKRLDKIDGKTDIDYNDIHPDPIEESSKSNEDNTESKLKPMNENIYVYLIVLRRYLIVVEYRITMIRIM